MPFVYFIQVGESGPIKIGYADDVSKRLSQLQTGHHEELHIVGTLIGDMALEKAIHRHLAEHRIRGEWFRQGFDIEEVRRKFNKELNVEASAEYYDPREEVFAERIYTVVKYWIYRLGTEPYFIDETIDAALKSIATEQVFAAIDRVERTLNPAERLRAFIAFAQQWLPETEQEPSPLTGFDLSLVDGFDDYARSCAEAEKR